MSEQDESIARGSRRAGRRSFIAQEIRRMRALDRKRFELSVAGRARTLVALPEPIRAGWERYFFVRPDLARSPEGPTLERVLAVVQNVQHSGRKDFAERDWRRGGKKRATEHYPKRLTEQEFAKLDDKIQSHFKGGWEEMDNGRRELVFRLKEPWKFVSRTRAYYLTHRALPNSEIDSAKAHVDGQLYGKGWPYRHLLRQVGDSYRDWYDRREDAPAIENEEEA